MKRLLDLVIVLVASPFILIIAFILWVGVRVNFGAPALFSQWRPGLGGRPFLLRKFRTMTNVCDETGVLLSDEERLTSLGRWLRSTSLDELPEFWNILNGEMSLVGPRPLLMEYLPRYSPRQARRHAVRPGLTGLAQVRGRNAAPWEQKFEWDIEYVERCSFLLDLRILLQTAIVVFRREGISHVDHATMEEFKGSR